MLSSETPDLFANNPLWQLLLKHPSVHSWIAHFSKTPDRIRPLQNIHISILPPILYSILHSSSAPLAVLSQSNSLLELLYELLASSTAAQRVAFFPTTVDDARESIPASFTSSPARFRQKAVEILRSRNDPMLLTSQEGLITPVYITPSKNHGPVCIEVGARLSLRVLLGYLTRWRFQRTNTVFLPGYFALRGGIVDIFPPSQALPIRIEFDGNTVSSIRVFHPETQLSERMAERVVVHAPYAFPFSGSRPVTVRSLLPRAIKLKIVPTPHPDVVALEPYNEEEATCSTPTDLGCLPHKPLNNNVPLFKELVAQDANNKDLTVFVISESRKQANYLSKQLGRRVKHLSAPIPGSFWSTKLGLSVFSYPDVIGIPRRRFSPWGVGWKTAQARGDIGSFTWREFLVHEHYGIGRYRGLKTLNTSLGSHDCIVIEYDGGDLVYVPATSLHLVHKYIGEKDVSPKLSRLGSTLWERQKQRTRRSAETIVKEFVHLYAARTNVKGFSFSPDSTLHLELESSFPFEETDDQQKAIEEVKADMESDRPMERLLCGDVGFGKTEVALRAAFKAVYDQKQVMLLVPTTILANQHYLTFKERLEPFGVRVCLLSRFKSKRDQARIVESLNHGHIDIVIGTQRLLSQDVQLPKLGLLIIDEEHRFGAQQKEKIKKLRRRIDVLAMSATPIPRTLQLSLIGIRDISRIETPPLERLAIITRIYRKSDTIISQAIVDEVQRGGQVFFVHNDVATIDTVAKNLSIMLPTVRFGVAHGKMHGARLESTMLSFLEKQLDVLVCTTIIEAGIDLRNVNTILINNAHTFGLSQLYQMRGRVGRSNRQAFCYLLVPDTLQISPNAYARLKTIEFYSTLGAGYHVALKDLEMRGAGNLFGVEQSGHIVNVGLNLFLRIIQEAINEQLSIPLPAADSTEKAEQIDVGGDSLIPDSYIPDISDRLQFYRRFGLVASVKDILALKDELQDRFGPLPDPVKNLILTSIIQLLSSDFHLKKLSLCSNGLKCLFRQHDSIEKTLSLLSPLQQKLVNTGRPHEFSPVSNGELSLLVETSTLSEARDLAKYLFVEKQYAHNF